jgi:hypothetical protein
MDHRSGKRAASLSGAAATWILFACGGSTSHGLSNEDNDASGSSLQDGATQDHEVEGDEPDVQVIPVDACAMGQVAPADDVRITDAGVDVEYVDAGVVQCAPGPQEAAACGALLCGNGMIDTCQPTRTDASDDFEPDAGSSFAVEACDGTALGGATCASLGFASGSLACTGFCDLDVSECEVCSPAAPGGSTCSALSPQAQSVAVAVNATEIAYAWVEQDSSCHGVRFDRFGLDLTRISESSCLDSCDAKSVDVAATPDGWLLAIGSSHGVDLLPLDPSGAESATPRTLPNAANPIFAQRGAGGSVAGGPLLMWGSATGGFDSFAAVLRTDGTEEQSALHTFSNVIPWAATATFIGDSFLLAYDANPTDAVPSSIVIRRLWLDGSLGAVRQPFPCRTSASNPVLTWTRSEGRLVFTDVPNTYWARLVRIPTDPAGDSKRRRGLGPT